MHCNRVDTAYVHEIGAASLSLSNTDVPIDFFLLF